jgi:hypothetical protein
MRDITILVLGFCSILAGCSTPPGEDGQDGTGASQSDPDLADGSGAGTANVAGWQASARLEAFDPGGEDLYGDRVATNGGLIAVGASSKDSLTGIVDVYTQFAGEWRYVTRLDRGSARFPEQGFGSAVAISNNRAIVGAYKYAVPGSFAIQTGAVYIFQNLGPQWPQLDVLTVNDADDFEYLGSSLAYSPDQGRIVAGAPGRARSQGAAYVLVRRGDTWDLETRIMAEDGINFEDFGDAVAIEGTTLVVGAPNQNFGTGAVYVYERDAEWTQSQKILAQDGEETDKFGNAVALQGDTLVIAAHAKQRPQDVLLSAGYVYIYKRNGREFELQQTLIPGDGDAGLFGTSIALDSGTLAVSANGDCILWEEDDGRWVETGRLSPNNETFILDSFGNAMALSDGTLVVGARSADAGGYRAAGAAFVFEKTDDSAPVIGDGVLTR